MLSPLHLGGRNYTCTEIKLSKIIMISVPYPPQVVSLWFQGNGSHMHGHVRSVPLGSSLSLVTLRVIAGSSAVSLSLSLCFYGVGLVVGILFFFSRQPFDCFWSPPY